MTIYLHHYPASLFSEKARALLGYLKLGWRSVVIPTIMPRPLLMPLSGGYRKTPCLQIGANVYEAQLALVNEEFEIAMARRAYTTKYKMPDPAPADAPPMRYWRVEPRS